MKKLILSVVLMLCSNVSGYGQNWYGYYEPRQNFSMVYSQPVVTPVYYTQPVVSYLYSPGYAVVYPYAYSNIYSGNWSIINQPNVYYPVVPRTYFPRRYFGNYSHYYYNY